MHCATVVLLSVTLLKVAGTGALRGISLLVTPPVVEKGEDVELTCNYDLEGAPLYAIKFYRGVHEFYRYCPKDNPSLKLFPFPGLNVDLSQSQDSRVVVRSADYSLAGNVSCEVSTDAPEFRTGIVTENIVVVELPRSQQRIDAGAEATYLYEAGDRLKAKCTSAPSRPAPSLSWFINDEPATTNSTRWTQRNQLETREVTLDLVLLPRHVASGRITLRCTALVASVYKETVNRTFDTRSGPGEPQHDRVRLSSATIPQLLPWRLLVALTLALLSSLR